MIVGSTCYFMLMLIANGVSQKCKPSPLYSSGLSGWGMILLSL